MDPHVSRLGHPVTEYSATQGSSGFSKEPWPGMDPFDQLLDLRQGNSSIEEYVTQFCELSYGVLFDEVALKDIFRLGLNEPVKSWLPEGQFNVSLKDFMDYTLLCAGSSFTVGVAEKERDTVSVTEMADAPECTHKMADTKTHRHFSADLHESSQVTADVKEPSQVTADVNESIQATADLRESNQVTVDHRESNQATVDRHESSHASADHPESHHVTADHPESHHVSALQPESLHVSALQPESLHVSALQPESLHLGTLQMLQNMLQNLPKRRCSLQLLVWWWRPAMYSQPVMSRSKEPLMSTVPVLILNSTCSLMLPL